MQRTQPGGPVTKPKFVTKPEVPAGAPLSLGSRNADDAMSSVRMGQAALEQSALQAQGHIGAGDETAESVVQGVTNKRQAQSTEQELGKLATEVRKWELVRNAIYDRPHLDAQLALTTKPYLLYRLPIK